MPEELPAVEHHIDEVPALLRLGFAQGKSTAQLKLRRA